MRCWRVCERVCVCVCVWQHAFPHKLLKNQSANWLTNDFHSSCVTTITSHSSCSRSLAPVSTLLICPVCCYTDSEMKRILTDLKRSTLYTLLAAEEEGTGTCWPACSPVLSPIENVWRIWSAKMRQRRPRTVAHLKTCLQEEWDKITPETLHHLVSSVPKRL